MTKQNKPFIKRIVDATRFSCKGLVYAWQNEQAFRQEVIAGIVLIPLALILGDTVVEQVLMLMAGVLVLIAEIINSAIEAVVDRVGVEHHPLAGHAKDLGSAAVFVSMILMAVTWLLLLIN